MFSEGDLRAFANTMLHDLRDAGLDIKEPHKWTEVVVTSLRYMLPNDSDKQDARVTMTDFETPTIEGTAAEKAVIHIITRVRRDPNFRYYMLGTESLALCLKADAERRGESPEVIKQITALANPPLAYDDGGRIADVLAYRTVMERIASVAADLRDRGVLPASGYAELDRATRVEN